MYCCGPAFLFFAEGHEIGQFGNTSESCTCNEGWISIGFNPYPTECDQGATICTGNVQLLQVCWWMICLGQIFVSGLRTIVVVKEGRKALLEVYKFIADGFLMMIVLGNFVEDFAFDLVANKIGYIALCHWLFFASVYNRLILMRGMVYLHAKAIYQGAKKSGNLKLSEYQRAKVDSLIMYIVFCWPCWSLVFFFDSLDAGRVIQYAHIGNCFLHFYSFLANVMVMKKIIKDLKYVRDLTTGKVVARLNKAIRVSEANLQRYKTLLFVVPITQVLFAIFYQVLRETNYLMLLFFFPVAALDEIKVLIERLRTGRRAEDLLFDKTKTHAVVQPFTDASGEATNMDQSCEEIH